MNNTQILERTISLFNKLSAAKSYNVYDNENYASFDYYSNTVENYDIIDRITKRLELFSKSIRKESFSTGDCFYQSKTFVFDNFEICLTEIFED